MSKYGDGYRFECLARDDLKARGYEVIRSAGSKGKIDLIAISPGKQLFVQCKLNGKCPEVERIEIRRIAAMVGAVPIVAYRYKDGSRAAVVKYKLLTGEGLYDFKEWKAGE